MTGHGVHVHAAHEHEIEHHAMGGHGLSQYVAIFTAILATLGALIGYQLATTLNDAMLYKNEAVLKKTEASNQWNFYQAKSGKQHLMEIAADISKPDVAKKYLAQASRYDKEKKTIRKEAETLEAASLKANKQSASLMQPVHLLEQAMILLQLAISLASITALTRTRWLFVVAGVSAIGALTLTTISLLS